MTSQLTLNVEFGGGLELLFSNQRLHTVSLPSYIPQNLNKSTDGSFDPTQRPANVTFLLNWLKQNLLKEREELFMDGDSVRPGILVLINDTDWEIEGEGDYVLRDNDEIVLISTLHGG
ncbi:ubiquitin-like modifier 1 [Hysterangium stoloniferum]|nr:ubiquitin-like modifier 1 [Hysterangium stoloniferum]